MRTKNKYRVDNNTEGEKGVRTTRKELINRRKKTRKQSRNKKRIKSHNKKSHKLDSNNFIIHKGRKIDTKKTNNNKTKKKSRYNKGDIYIDNDVFNYFFGGKLSDSQYKITFPLNDYIIDKSKWLLRTKKAGDTKKLLDKDTSIIKEELNKLAERTFSFSESGKIRGV